MMYNHYLRYPQSTAKSFFQPDHLHPNARGHVSATSCITGRLFLVSSHSLSLVDVTLADARSSAY
jgi:hypothetical protein